MFSTMDAASGFYQVPREENDIGKTGFTCKYGTFEYEVMPMELKNAAATFQRLMNRVIADYLGLFVMAYIDDIVVYSESMEEHADHLEWVFKRLREANIKLKWKKCSFGFNTIQFLGHQVSGVGLWPSDRTAEKLREMRRPNSRNEMEAFFGLCGYYRRFVPSYTEMAASLTE